MEHTDWISGGMLAVLMALSGCNSRQAQPDLESDGPSDAAPLADSTRGGDAAPSDLDAGCSIPRVRDVTDADPRSLVDAQIPDWGPFPDSLPPRGQSIWGVWPYDEDTLAKCANRPPRILPDGSSECDYVGHATPV